MDKVSVIVPAFNTADYIEKSICSLENQTYRNIEIIIVEDCSTDHTLKVCRRLAQNHDNIILLEHETNLGLEATREDGIAAATGEWIMFLDSDDVYLFDGIERVMALAKEYQPDIILCSYARVVSGVSTPCEFGLNTGVYSVREICERMFTDLSLYVISCVGSKVYRKDFIIENSIHFDKRFKFNEDGGYIYSCLKNAKKIVAADIPFYQYAIRTSGSIQSSYRKDMFSTISNADRYLREVLIQYDCFDGKVADGYFERRASIMLGALSNEAKYSTISAYKTVADSIRQDEDYENVCALVKERKVSRVIRAMLLCLKYHLNIPPYIALKTRRHLLDIRGIMNTQALYRYINAIVNKLALRTKRE